MVRIRGFHPRDPGSSPGGGILLLLLLCDVFDVVTWGLGVAVCDVGHDVCCRLCLCDGDVCCSCMCACWARRRGDARGQETAWHVDGVSAAWSAVASAQCVYLCECVGVCVCVHVEMFHVCVCAIVRTLHV